MATATLLLSERAQFGGQRLSEAVGNWLARADVRTGEGPQLARMFDVLPRGWPVAAVTRQRDVGDALDAVWVRADPAYLRPEINGARLMAHGEGMGLTAWDIDALMPQLMPLFGDAGFLLDAALASRWYLRLPAGAKLPGFASPDEVLGADVFDQLPGVASGTEREGRRWRALLSETQVLLHNHPHNAQRIAAGLPPVNSLWFWGGGSLPDHVRTQFGLVQSDDDALRAFALLAGSKAVRVAPRWQHADGEHLVDLRQLRDLTRLQADWLVPLMEDVAARRLKQVTLDFADDAGFLLAAPQRWRFWRRSLRSLAP